MRPERSARVIDIWFANRNHFGMRSAAIACGILLSSSLAFADPSFEKIRDTSPDGKFAMRIQCDSEPDDPENIDTSVITAIDLVSLPAKKVVASLLPADDVGSTYSEVTLLWSTDSKWCAFYYAQPRVGYTSVFHVAGSELKKVNKPEALMGKVHGDVRNEYIKPTKWLKPGQLQLEQYSIMRGGDGESDVKLQLTAGLNPKGKFVVISQKKLPND
jgi:hypothetical protein